MTTATNLLNVARKYIGTTQGGGTHLSLVNAYNKINPLPVGYKIKSTDDWCDMFVSVVAKEAGAQNLIGAECSVQRHIDIFKKLGIWIEDGTITPKAGDIITYNWDDGTQPNDGWADHIGFVEKVSGAIMTLIEGNYGRKVQRRTLAVGHGNIRGYARPKYKAETATTNTTKSITDLAHEVIAGKHGTGDARKKALGSQYTAVQAKVNELLKSTSSKKTNAQVAREIYLGQGGWGNGATRTNKLKAAGYDPAAVQKEVNKLF